MKEKDIIKSYFENYYPNNDKYVYHEDWGIAAVIFLFLIFLMTKTLSSEKTPEIVSNKIENDPYIPERIIKNLENIKKILTEHNPGKNLKETLELIDDIDDNLNLLKKRDDIKNIVSIINDQLIKFLQQVLQLYSVHESNKKNILFNELNKILHLFGLSDIFKALLKNANSNNEIRKDNSTEKVVLTAKDLDDVIEISPEVSGEEDDEEDEDEEEITLDNKPSTNNDDDDLFMDKNLDDIKKEIKSKQNIINSMPDDVKKIYKYIINDFSKYDEDQIKYLHVILYDDIESFDENFRQTEIFEKARDFLEEEDASKDKKPYDKLLDLLTKNNIFIRKYQGSFWIKIDVEKYKIKKIKPLKSSDNSDAFYYMMFFSNSEEFEIKIKQKFKDKYRLYSSLNNFTFILNEDVNDDEFLDSEIICKGEWGYDDDSHNVEIKIIDYYSDVFKEKKASEIIKTSKTFIGKLSGNKIKQLVSPQNSEPTPQEKFYYCIKNDGNYFILEINHNFLLSLKEIYNKKHFKYRSNNFTTTYYFNDKDDLKDLILIDIQTGRIHKFLNNISKLKTDPLNFDDLIFSKINLRAVNDTGNLINIDKSKINWLN